MPLKLVSWAPFEMMPEVDAETVPYWLVKVIPSAQAAMGKTIAINAKTTTRLILSALPKYFVAGFYPGVVVTQDKGRPAAFNARSIPKPYSPIYALLSIACETS
jgi:hypothetical protein